MNKLSQLTYWSLIAVAVASATVFVSTAIQLHQTNELNAFIANVEQYEDTPEMPKAMLAKAYTLVQQDKGNEALDMLSHVVASDDSEVTIPALMNRANINLREALRLEAGDKKRIPLTELAKQDYRKALLIDPNQWDIRYNLELALTVVPELPEEDVIFEKPSVLRQRTVESKGFKVDLP